MTVSPLSSEFQEALPILHQIEEAGFEAYFVGGSVRDALLGKPIHDVDIATSAYPQEIKAIFPKTVDIGIEHGTVLVLAGNHKYEVTTFRSEDAYVDYRRPSSVSFVRSLEEDLKRRDFTINAFALGRTGDVIDLYEGMTDLHHKRLRAVGIPLDRFNEDALRILRGFRFAASLDFEIEERTFEAMRKTAPLLEKISIERSFVEMDKLLTVPAWKKGLGELLRAGAHRYLPDLKEAYTGLTRMMATLADTAVCASTEAWAFVILFLEVAHPSRFLKKWKTATAFQKMVTDLVMLYRLRLTQDYSLEILYQYGLDRALKVEEMREKVGLPSDATSARELDKRLYIRDKGDIVINGSYLIKEMGFTPGPALGRCLKAVEEAIVTQRITNDLPAIIAFIKEMGYE